MSPNENFAVNSGGGSYIGGWMDKNIVPKKLSHLLKPINSLCIIRLKTSKIKIKTID
jgi:hypothetical protein